MSFQFVDINGARPGRTPWPERYELPTTGWIGPTRHALSGYTDPNWPYTYHRHRLSHEDRGMMGQFVVVNPGQQPGMPPGMEHDHA
jgi:FtsP/CotA-like multicopper oxidase with cupredoxin domain